MHGGYLSLVNEQPSEFTFCSSIGTFLQKALSFSFLWKYAFVTLSNTFLCGMIPWKWAFDIAYCNSEKLNVPFFSRPFYRVPNMIEQDKDGVILEKILWVDSLTYWSLHMVLWFGQYDNSEITMCPVTFKDNEGHWCCNIWSPLLVLDPRPKSIRTGKNCWRMFSTSSCYYVRLAWSPPN